MYTEIILTESTLGRHESRHGLGFGAMNKQKVTSFRINHDVFKSYSSGVTAGEKDQELISDDT